jgi:hypothetical protein
MGILDEAIREHLDLKRRRGAGESEIKRLESEAFGPSSRPGATGLESPQPARAETAVADVAPPDVALSPEDLQRAQEAPERDQGPEGDQAPGLEAPGEPEEISRPAEPSDAGEPGGAGTTFHDLAAEEGLVEPVARPTEPPERSVEEGPLAPGVEDTQPHDVERELAAEDSGGPDVLDLDELDLELEEEAEEALPQPTEEAREPEAAAEVIEEVPEQEEVAEPGVEPVTEEEPDEDAAEDVLEETPEFLRDTPESDRLWFEQGEPQDFDFDEKE